MFTGRSGPGHEVYRRAGPVVTYSTLQVRLRNGVAVPTSSVSKGPSSISRSRSRTRRRVSTTSSLCRKDPVEEVSPLSPTGSVVYGSTCLVLGPFQHIPVVRLGLPELVSRDGVGETRVWDAEGTSSWSSCVTEDVGVVGRGRRGVQVLYVTLDPGPPSSFPSTRELDDEDSVKWSISLHYVRSYIWSDYTRRPDVPTSRPPVQVRLVDTKWPHVRVPEGPHLPSRSRRRDSTQKEDGMVREELVWSIDDKVLRW